MAICLKHFSLGFVALRPFGRERDASVQPSLRGLDLVARPPDHALVNAESTIEERTALPEDPYGARPFIPSNNSDMPDA
jgi:hypothetical protein